MVWVWENLSNNLKSIYSIFVHWQGLVQAAILRRRRETEYVDVYHERCQVCICICICKYMDERQNMWTFIMSFVRFARSNTSPIKHSLINAMIRLFIFPNRKEEKIGGRSRGAVWGGAICKYSVLTVHRYQFWDLYCKHWIYQTKLTHCIVSKATQPPSLSPEPLDDEYHMCWRSNIWWNRPFSERSSGATSGGEGGRKLIAVWRPHQRANRPKTNRTNRLKTNKQINQMAKDEWTIDQIKREGAWSAALSKTRQSYLCRMDHCLTLFASNSKIRKKASLSYLLLTDKISVGKYLYH